MFAVEIRYTAAGQWSPFPQQFATAAEAQAFAAQQAAMYPAPTRDWQSVPELRAVSVPAAPVVRRRSNRKHHRYSMGFSGRYVLQDAAVRVTIIRVRRATRQAIGNYRGQPPLWDLYVNNQCVAQSLPSFRAAEERIPAEVFATEGVE